VIEEGLYDGVVVHTRHRPVEHSFSRRLAMPLIRLGDDGHLDHLRPLMSNRPSPLWWRRGDHLPDAPGPLEAAVRDAVGSELGWRPDGAIFLLAQPRTWGWCFNPLSVFYCCGAGGEVRAVVLEVTNTPWHERHAYVLDARDGLGQGFGMAKMLHVSPFMAMAQRYRVRLGEPGEHCRVGIGVSDGEGLVFSAGMSLRRRPLTRATLARSLRDHPLLSHRVSASIYSEAVALWRRGAPVHGHPRRDAAAASARSDGPDAPSRTPARAPVLAGRL
jgi:DUF1365 family protein